MAVFPEQMDRLNLQDTTGSLQKIENYIRYMAERMEFSSSNTSKFFAETGTTNASVIKALLTVADRVSLIEANINMVVNNTTALANSVSKLQGSVDTLSGTITSMQTEIENLKSRVQKLEGGTEA